MEIKTDNYRRTSKFEVPEAQTFYPTIKEFKNFSKYVRDIEAKGAHKAGICKIVPPKEWIPRKVGYLAETFPFKIAKPLKQSFTAVGEKEGAFQTKCLSKQPMTVLEYEELTQSRMYKPPNANSEEELEDRYWRDLGKREPIYGADVAESITDPDIKEFNIAKLDSILNVVAEETNEVFYGVNSPYLYFGMYGATFSWHVEDMDLYGINMVHHGAPKTWYCVPPRYGHLMEKAAKDLFPRISKWCSNFMRHKTCMISPMLLSKLGVPFQKMVQREREIIIVFPYAYHAGFNHGYNIAESTNFASERWIEYGKRHRPCDCSAAKVKIDMTIFVKKFQPEKLQAWMDGTDIEPHPEDPESIAQEIRRRAQDPKTYVQMLEETIKTEDEELLWYQCKDGSQVFYDLQQNYFLKNFILNPEEQKQFDHYKRLVVDSQKGKIIASTIYQHVEMRRVKIQVFDDTGNCCEEQLEDLKTTMGMSKLPNVASLIQKGQFVKIGRRRVHVPLESIRPETEQMKQDIVKYKHLCEDLSFVVYASTLDLAEQPNAATQTLLKKHSPRSLIRMGIFFPIGPAQVEKPLVPPSCSVSSPSSSVIERKTFDIYQFKGTNVTVKVKPKTIQKAGGLNTEARRLLAGRSISDCIKSGDLIFIHSDSFLQRRRSKSSSKSDSAPIFSDPGQKEAFIVSTQVIEKHGSKDPMPEGLVQIGSRSLKQCKVFQLFRADKPDFDVVMTDSLVVFRAKKTEDFVSSEMWTKDPDKMSKKDRYQALALPVSDTHTMHQLINMPHLLTKDEEAIQDELVKLFKIEHTDLKLGDKQANGLSFKVVSTKTAFLVRKVLSTQESSLASSLTEPNTNDDKNEKIRKVIAKLPIREDVNLVYFDEEADEEASEPEIDSDQDSPVKKQSEPDSDPDFDAEEQSKRKRKRGQKTPFRASSVKKMKSNGERPKFYDDPGLTITVVNISRQCAEATRLRGSFEPNEIAHKLSMTADCFERFFVVFRGLEIVKPLNKGSFEWIGVNDQRIRNAIREWKPIPKGRTDSPWFWCQKVLMVMISKDQDQWMPYWTLQDLLCPIGSVEEEKRSRDRCASACNILATLGVVNRDDEKLAFPSLT